ncbi:MAG: glycosyltransferase [Gammaproteobacteria bacterium]|nr:glycosyltransferase [Flavobacteriaceae bacterium]MCW5584177.1 glycosyltransferase [Gammaproteobacteria bacterium]
MQEKCLVIPCYNEANRIPLDQFTIHYQQSQFNYCFVNDGSADSTLSKLLDFRMGKEQNVLIVDCKINGGKSAAVREGMLQALAWKDFEIVGFADADLATPLYEIDRLVELFNTDTQMVFGSRIKTLSTKINRKIYRHYLGRIISTLISFFILRLPIYDTQCGIKLFRASLAREVFTDQFSTGWLFDVELFLRVKAELNEGISRVIEVPLNEWDDKKDSKVSFLQGFGILSDFWWLFRNRKNK